MLLTSCATADLSRADVAGVVVDAFAAADTEVTDVDVGAAPVDGRWPATAEIDGQTVTVQVDTQEGRVVSLDLGSGTPALTQEQLEAVAAHADNPSQDRARRGQLLVLFAVFAAVVAGGLAVARQLRLREEAHTVEPTPTHGNDL